MVREEDLEEDLEEVNNRGPEYLFMHIHINNKDMDLKEDVE